MINRNDFHISFLTWNLYMGTDLTPLMSAPSDQITGRVTEVFRKFLATNFHARMKEIASQIALKKPDFIGLQEAVKWQLAIPNFRIITYDFLQLLLNELFIRGLNYKIAVQNRNASAELPDSHGNIVRLLDRDVILIRNDQRLKVIKENTSNFKSNLTFQFNGQIVKIRRGWSSVDVKTDGRIFRMINTHLETIPEIQIKQAREILSGPAKTELPLILTGDLNSNAVNNDTPTYRNFINAGFHDAWSKVGNGPGFTCCQDADQLNSVSGLNSRIDFILYKNGWVPIEADIVGENQQDRTTTGLWPSDHAGVLARFILKGCSG